MRTLIFSARRHDFRVDTMRGSGPGGQHVNKVESAVRITHIMTGLSAESREERSQHANKRKAFQRLVAKLVKLVEEQHKVQRLINTEYIRTYHEPDDRVVDKASGQRWSYREVVKKPDLSGPITARRLAMQTT